MQPQTLPPMPNRTLLWVRTPRTGDESPAATALLLATLATLSRKILINPVRLAIPFSLELTSLNQQIRFCLNVPSREAAFVTSQVLANYPHAHVTALGVDHIDALLSPKETLALGQLKLRHGQAYPLRTYQDFRDLDPLRSTLAVLSRAKPQDRLLIQYLLLPSGKLISTSGGGDAETIPASLLRQKRETVGFKTAIRLAANTQNRERSHQLLRELAGSFGSLASPQANSLSLRYPFLWQGWRLQKALRSRERTFIPNQLLTSTELATLYHFPTKPLAVIPNIAWTPSILSEPPENLPVMEPETTHPSSVNYFAQTYFRTETVRCGIKDEDRRRHLFILGKTGSGKSTLLANLALNDIRNGKGLCLIDIHGDLAQTIHAAIPAERKREVVYVDPTDPTDPFRLNPLEVVQRDERELVVSGIIAIFRKLWPEFFGPRMEHIFRMALYSVIDLPNAILPMVTHILTDARFRAAVLAKHVTDPVITAFWEHEFDEMSDRLRTEAISPVLNKVGQFVADPKIRRIIGAPRSTINLRQLMDTGKILILNLNDGRFGEDNAKLLGALLITKLQLAAMSRVDVPEAKRRDYLLYVDEFQNFATESFAKILSEARKYRLSLTLANQYLDQIPDQLRKAIFGNVGSMVLLQLGAHDAKTIAPEVASRFTVHDLLALGKHEAITKLCIDGQTSPPFLVTTLPPASDALMRRGAGAA